MMGMLMHVHRYECSSIHLEREMKGMNILKLVRCQIFPKGLYQFIPINILNIAFLQIFLKSLNIFAYHTGVKWFSIVLLMIAFMIVHESEQISSAFLICLSFFYNISFICFISILNYYLFYRYVEKYMSVGVDTHTHIHTYANLLSQQQNL